MYLTLALKSTWGVHGLYGPCILCAWWWCVAVVCVAEGKRGPLNLPD